MSVNHFGNLSDLSRRNIDARGLRAVAQALCDLTQDLRIGMLHRDVVDLGDRTGADAEKIVRIHGDAVDSDGVVPPHLLGQQEFRPDPIG